MQFYTGVIGDGRGAPERQRERVPQVPRVLTAVAAQRKVSNALIVRNVPDPVELGGRESLLRVFMMTAFRMQENVHYVLRRTATSPGMRMFLSSPDAYQRVLHFFMDWEVFFNVDGGAMAYPKTDPRAGFLRQYAEIVTNPESLNSAKNNGLVYVEPLRHAGPGYY